MYVVTTYALNKMLAQLIDHAVAGPYSGVLDGLYLGLAQFPSAMLNPNQGLSDLTEANYGGYARQAVVWEGPYIIGGSTPVIQAKSLFFSPTDSTESNQITVLFLADALTDGNLILSEPLPGGPIFLSSPADAFSVAPVFQLAANANYGDAVIIR